jgi:SAM-dependent methyltransferase
MFHAQGPTFWELAVQALSSTERGYDLLAPKFDYTPFRTPDEVLEIVAGQIAGLGSFQAGLDLCCGTGAGMGILRPICNQRVVGVDVSAGMLAVAREKLRDAPGAAALEFIRGDVLQMPLPEGAFDLAVCFGAFGHILQKDQSRMVRETARVLRPGGRFVFVTSYLPPLWSLDYWWRRTFNGVMRLRNWLIPPPFIMYYLTFLLPGAQTLLEAHGFDVEAREGLFAKPWTPLILVVATRRSNPA